MSGPIIQRLTNTGAGGGGVISDIEKGFETPGAFVPRYFSSVNVSISPGYIEANGSIYYLATATNHLMTSLAAAVDNHYIYIDDDASSAPNATIIDSTTEPAFNAAKGGWYNGNDKLIGVVTNVLGLTATLDRFETIVYGKLTRNITLKRFTLGLNMNPTGSWQTPNTNESDIYAPVNAVELRVHIVDNRAGASPRSSWASNEWAAAEPTNWQLTPQYTRGFSNKELSSWGSLGASRKIKMIADSADANDFSAYAQGYGYLR
jgi:hypothetical protein